MKQRARGARRSWIVCGALVALAGTLAYGQDQATPEQVRKRYADALAQLKAAQDRKTELAADNERLAAKLADAQRDLESARRRGDDLARQTDEFAERTFFLRAHYAAWRDFVRHDPALRQRWEAFLSAGGPGPPGLRAE